MLSRRCTALIALSFALVGAAPTGSLPPNPRAVPNVLDVAIAIAEFEGEPNTMMFTATVRVDQSFNNALHDAVVGHVRDADYLACNATTPWTYSTDAQRFSTMGTSLQWTLYNFVPDTTYHYVVRTGSGGNYKYSCGSLPTPTLPPAVGALNFQYEEAGAFHPYASRYVLLNMDDCGATGATASGSRAHLLVLDTDDQKVVWYFDIDAMTGLEDPAVTGWRYLPATASAPARVLVLIDKRYLYEWSLDGTLVRSRDFGATCADDHVGPCAHHDVVESEESGNLYVIMSRESRLDPTGTLWEACGTTSKFVNDGYEVLDDTFGTMHERYLMTDYGYDPVIEPGPYSRRVVEGADVCAASTWTNYLRGDVIDWTHVNSLDLTMDGTTEVLDISLHGWDQVIRVDATDGSYIWSLAGEESFSELGLLQMAPGIAGRATFSGQHDVHTIADDTLLMLDNLGDEVGSRVLRISSISTDPTIDASWALVDAHGAPLDCPVEGSAQEVPDTAGANVLSVCQDAYTVVELDDSAGFSTAPGIHPPLVISLPDGTTDAFCTVGGPTERRFLRGLYRAYPLSAVGAFE